MLGLITGNHPRHLFLADKLISTGLVECWVIETRENFVPDSNFIKDKDLKNLFDIHFQKRKSPKNFGSVKSIILQKMSKV